MAEAGTVPAWLGNPDVMLLRDVATAVVRFDSAVRLQSFTLPYPAEAQRALDRVVLACLRVGARPPSGLPELIRWCRARPLGSWPLDQLPDSLFGSEDRLIDAIAGSPTQLCHELAVRGRGDSAARQYDRLVIREAMRVCQEAWSPECYTAFRRMLVTRPVLTEDEWLELSTDLYLDPVRFLVEEIYAPVPAGYGSAGTYLCCARCLTLLTPLSWGGWWCERDQCRHQGAAPHGRVLETAEVGEIRQLRRPLRQFVTSPGQAEVALERELRSLGLSVEMWPGFDAYDLRITFPDGYVWAVDVKDWAHPGFLGSTAEAVRPDPPYDEACWVVPCFRAETRPGYLDAFARERPAHARGLRLLTDDQLSRAARVRLSGERGPGARIGKPATPQNGADDA